MTKLVGPCSCTPLFDMEGCPLSDWQETAALGGAPCQLQNENEAFWDSHTSSCTTLQIPFDEAGAPLGDWVGKQPLMEAYHIAAVEFQLHQACSRPEVGSRFYCGDRLQTELVQFDSEAACLQWNA